MILNTVRNHKLFVLFVFLVLSLCHLFIVVCNHYTFKTTAYDYGVYNFAFFDFAHFRVSPCPIYLTEFNITFLQDHFSLTLVFLSPLYWVLSPLFGTYTLLILQWMFIVWGAWASYKLILLKTDQKHSALAALVFYFILYGRFSAYQSDCNLVIMSSAMLPVFLYYFEKRKLIPSVLVFVFVLFSREDSSLNLFFLCIMLCIVNRGNKSQLRLAAIMALSSLLAFICIFKFFIPLLEDGNKQFSLFNYQALGKNPFEAALFLASHPFDSIKLLFMNHTTNSMNDFIKFKFYLVYFLSGGFILFYRPVYFIALLPLIAKKMFNDDSMRWSHESYYGVEVATILPILVFSTLIQVRSDMFQRIWTIVILLFTSCVTWYCLFHPSPLYYGAAKFNFLSKPFYDSSMEVSKINELLKDIPEETSVCASCRILPHLAFRQKIYYFPQLKDAEYVIIATNDVTFPVSREEYDFRIQQLRENKEFTLIRNEKELLLFKRLK